MSSSPYRVLGVGVPPMLGREQLFEDILRHLIKAMPDHMCVVGPPLFGKSVLLKHLASHFESGRDHYLTALYWDLRHGTPQTDVEFRRRFAARVKEALKPVQPDLSEDLALEEEELGELLRLVLEELEKRGLRILAVLDGFDHVLAGSGITGNLWSEMRDLGQRASLRLVTGSRRRLRELCRTEDSRTSDFWEIFYDTPLKVGCFQHHDWSGFLSPFNSRRVQLDRSARKEIRNWTGGVPVLSAALADRLFAGAREGVTLSKLDVDRAASVIVEERRELLAVLWENCSIELQADLAALADRDMPLSEVPDQRRRDLELRGFADSSRIKLRSSCRLMATYARHQASDVENLRRLFGDAERFEGNIRSLLELRLAQVGGVDLELRGYVERAIRDLHPDASHSVVWMRSIAERALNLIWAAELPLDRSLPGAWKFLGVRYDRVPRRRGQQCNLLRLITGTEEHAPVSQFVTKSTYLLVDHLQSVGDFGQHKEDDTVSVPIAAAFCLTAIGVCESLSRDLATPRRIPIQEGE